MAARPTHRRAYGVRILNSNHQEVRRLKREGWVAEIHGHKFWNSSFLVMDYLRENPPKTGVRVLEIGCGWGLLGIFCGREFDARVTGIDADENVLPYMELHADINDVDVTAQKATFQQLTVEKLKKFDLILGADICFWDEMANLLFNLIGRADKAGVKQVMIADPCRPPFEDLTERCTEKYGDRAWIEEMWLDEPVNASGEILIVDLEGARKDAKKAPKKAGKKKPAKAKQSAGKTSKAKIGTKAKKATKSTKSRKAAKTKKVAAKKKKKA